ncbi:MAG: hypothetical protein ABJZ55_01000 [Fuerstiella sp.]
MKRFLLGIICTAVAAATAVSQADDRPVTRPHGVQQRGAQQHSAQFAKRMEALLASTRQTDYQHTTSIDQQKGMVLCNCSGLIGFVLRNHHPEAYISLRGAEATWRRRPVAVTYYETFMAAGKKDDQSTSKQNGSWHQVNRIRDAVPGDIVAWRKKKLEKGSTTGHVCMVAGPPEDLGDGKVRVRIIDSTRNSQRRGFGSGFKTFVVDDTGKPTGYINGTRQVKSQIAVGRLAVSNSTDPELANTDLVGMNVDQAIVLAKRRKLDVRIICQDGKPQPVPWKIIPDRLNFIVQRGTVIRIARG